MRAARRTLERVAKRVTSMFLTDAAPVGDRRAERAEIERRIRNLRARLWSDPGDRVELAGMIEQLEGELRRLDRGGGEHA